LDKLQVKSEASKQAENFQKFVLAISEDIRVLLIKLADRLHNMRTLGVRRPEKQTKVARETMEIYVPLAERIGMQNLKDQLEDWSFKFLHPEAYESISTRLSFLKKQGKDQVAQIMEQLQNDIAEHGIKGEITGREKRPYSIWRKMQKQNIAFEQVCDVMAFRIVVDTVEECYQTLGVINTKYPMIPGRYKDYISTPKPNGYKSLHTGVIGPLNQRIEVQIRTEEMHQVAEYGLAAHWEYKQGIHRDGKQYRWLRDLLDLMQHCSDPNEFLEHSKIAMYQDQVFCFSPKGDLITLPKDATPIDFAYAVHSHVGDKCVGAKINGKIKPLRTILQNGDQVEILTAKNQTPSPEWERIAVTSKARANIRRFLRMQKRKQYVEAARNMFVTTSKEYGLTWNEKDLEGVLKQYRAETVEDLLAMIGEGLAPFTEIFHTIHPSQKLLLKRAINFFKKAKTEQTTDKNMPVTGLVSGIALSFAKCCHPVPGDKIVGIVTTGKGVAIHTHDCPVLQKFADEPERWLDVSWNEDVVKDKKMTVRIKVGLEDQPDALTELLNVMTKHNVVVSNFTTLSRSNGWSEVYFDIDVKNSEHLDILLQAVRSCKKVSFANRVRGV
ncbi:MAG: bifunctional (p)ppGpp synthetase/guanosine-3',5'-bis(diphosphate) 3'-pyrophosphohydrolase, partial [Alphaproteobacteria bacterium]|nr:bifunctional (p)ppGpp synthetase/guanosine-3',5'-bis(diphosphate) 3'-pyrophosphohydrolase [Alphaproteobacteria bacterium]